MRRFLLGAVCALSAVYTPAKAETDWQQLGGGRLITNDVLFDLQDRWQTGSVATSRVFGERWTGERPNAPFELLELRILGQVMAPGNLRDPEPGDRPWAGALSAGLHTHFAYHGIALSMGADLVATGPQTGLDDFQTALHDAIGIAPARISTLDAQIGNDFWPSAVFEAAHEFRLGEKTRVRPFFEARAGVETLARVGVDVTVGRFGLGELMVRDPVTGHRYRAIEAPKPGASWVFGGDVAYVESSVFLPEDRGLVLTEARTRLRAGVQLQGVHNGLFYGVTYLAPEFEAQLEGQVTGSLRIDFEF